MEENKNFNQQPQEEENKKRKKFAPISWFKGLKKPLKIGVCAGAALIVASAITFPTLAACGVFNKKPVTPEPEPEPEIPTETIELEYEGYGSYSTDVNLVKGTKYIVKVNSVTTSISVNDGFSIYEQGGSDDVLFKYAENFSVEVDGTALKQHNSVLASDTELTDFMRDGGSEYFALANFTNGGGFKTEEIVCPYSLFNKEKTAGKDTINFSFTFMATTSGENVKLWYTIS